MQDPLLILPFAFPVGFVLFWLLIVTILSRLSGWPALSERFPDRPDEAVARFSWASGVMGLGVSMRSILTLTACRSGLRVAIWRIFGPFDRPFFVPWEALAVERRRRLFLDRVVLRFGRPPVGQLEISAGLADRLAAAAQSRWPRS